MAQPRSGYTLPVFACAAAIAAWRWLQEELTTLKEVEIDLVEPAETVMIPVEQVARLGDRSALAVVRNDPGENLDLTRDTPIWVRVEVEPEKPVPTTALAIAHETATLWVSGGEGIGRLVEAGDRPAIYRYAQMLFQKNLAQWVQGNITVHFTVILPEGRALAERTSNAAFGVVKGLSLLGISGISQPLSAPGQLEQYRHALQEQAEAHSQLIFCIGENGLDLARKLGYPPDQLVKTANWLGPLLVEAGLLGVSAILLFGYHGKLLKLAGGIFHTHHYVADGRQEILTAYCVAQGLPLEAAQQVFASASAEAALDYLRQQDAERGTNWVVQVYGAIAHQIDQRTQTYIQSQGDRSVQVGSVLFGRDRQIILQSSTAISLFPQDLLI